jgi:ketosteroid isomerase-like protein
MREILLFSVFAGVIPLLIVGQSDLKTKTTPIAYAAQQSGAAEQELIRLDGELMSAASRKDTTLVERMALKNFVFVNPGGGVEDKAQFMTGGPNIESIQTSNVVVRAEGDIAVLTGRAMVKGKLANGRDISGQYTYMRVFVKQGGQWRLAAMSAVPTEMGQPTPTSTSQPTPRPTP